jgi:hypothetical protein
VTTSHITKRLTKLNAKAVDLNFALPVIAQWRRASELGYVLRNELNSRRSQHVIARDIGDKKTEALQGLVFGG